MSDNNTWEQRWDRVEAGLVELHTQLAAIHDRIEEETRVRTALIDERIAATPEEVWMADEEQLRWLLRHACYHRSAYDLSRQLQNPHRPDLYLAGIDGRTEYENQGLPVLTLTLTKGQPVDDLEVAVRDWHTRWALGRDVMPIDILERTASEFGSWSMTWKLATDETTVRVVRYGQWTEHYKGPLHGALEYVAQHVWLNRPDGEDNYGYDD